MCLWGPMFASSGIVLSPYLLIFFSPYLLIFFSPYLLISLPPYLLSPFSLHFFNSAVLKAFPSSSSAATAPFGQADLLLSLPPYLLSPPFLISFRIQKTGRGSVEGRSRVEGFSVVSKTFFVKPDDQWKLAYIGMARKSGCQSALPFVITMQKYEELLTR